MAKSKIHREDGLLSAQMLNGIPEVDLGINTKLSNIERTEAAKRIMGMCSNSYEHLVNIYGFLARYFPATCKPGSVRRSGPVRQPD